MAYVQRFDEDGNDYYVHVFTDASLWAGDLPSHEPYWRQVQDPASGAWYFEHSETSRTFWTEEEVRSHVLGWDDGGNTGRTSLDHSWSGSPTHEFMGEETSLLQERPGLSPRAGAGSAAGSNNPSTRSTTTSGGSQGENDPYDRSEAVRSEAPLSYESSLSSSSSSADSEVDSDHDSRGPLRGPLGRRRDESLSDTDSGSDSDSASVAEDFSADETRDALTIELGQGKARSDSDPGSASFDADGTVTFVVYTLMLFLHGGLCEGPAAAAEGFFRGILAFFFALWLGARGVIQGSAKLTRHGKMQMREACIFMASVPSLLMIVPSALVYRNFDALDDDWKLRPLYTIVGRVDPRRFNTFVKGQGSDAANVLSNSFPDDCMDDLPLPEGSDASYRRVSIGSGLPPEERRRKQRARRKRKQRRSSHRRSRRRYKDYDENDEQVVELALSQAHWSGEREAAREKGPARL